MDDGEQDPETAEQGVEEMMSYREDRWRSVLGAGEMEAVLTP